MSTVSYDNLFLANIVVLNYCKPKIILLLINMPRRCIYLYKRQYCTQSLISPGFFKISFSDYLLNMVSPRKGLLVCLVSVSPDIDYMSSNKFPTVLTSGKSLYKLCNLHESKPFIILNSIHKSFYSENIVISMDFVWKQLKLTERFISR